MRGDVVRTPEGEEVVLVDIGLAELLDDEVVRVWDVTLQGHEQHPWHLHHNPYVVLSLQGSRGRMDWLDGSEPRFISEYLGGAVYRPVSPVHRLTNLEDRVYQNRLVELKDLGELRLEPVDIGEGARSIEGEPCGDALPDGREPVIAHPHVQVWTTNVAPGERRELALADVEHVLALVNARAVADDPRGGVSSHPGGSLTLTNDTNEPQEWFVVELTYRLDVEAIAGAAR